MSNVKISNLTELDETPASADEFAIVDKSDTTQAASGTTKRVTFDNVTSHLAPLDSPTFTGDVVVPDADASGEAIAQGQTGAELAGLVTRIGSDNTPSTGGVGKNVVFTNDAVVAADRDYLMGVGNDGQFYMRRLNDDGSIGENVLRVSSAGNVTFQCDVVEVPAPIADSHAATKEYVDDETSQLLPLAGGTLTGDLAIEDDSPAILLTDSNGIADKRRWRLAVRDNDLAIEQVADDGSKVGDRVNFFEGSTVFSTPVTVPDATSGTHAVNRSQLVAETSQLQPKAGDSIWIPADVIAAGVVGSPSLGGVGTNNVWRAWLLGGATSEELTCTAILPSWWEEYAWDVYWTNDGAGSGDVVFRPFIGNPAEADPGDALSISSAPALTTSTAPAQDAAAVTTVLTGAATGNAGLHLLYLQRTATNPADTLANDIGVIGYLLRRTA